jgi:hypothetical protein
LYIVDANHDYRTTGEDLATVSFLPVRPPLTPRGFETESKYNPSIQIGLETLKSDMPL